MFRFFNLLASRRHLSAYVKTRWVKTCLPFQNSSNASHQHHNEISSRVKIHLMPSFCANFTFCSISARDSSVWQEETAKLFFFLHFYVHIGFMVQIRGHKIMLCKDLFFICTCLHLWIKMIWIFKLSNDFYSTVCCMFY